MSRPYPVGEKVAGHKLASLYYNLTEASDRARMTTNARQHYVALL